MEALLEIKHLSKSFGRRRVVDDISFDVFGGEVFGFLGPNGAGKTTTIKLVMGFLFADEGDIIINHVSLRHDYEKAMSYLGGIVENPEMYKDFSGRTNLEMYARLHGVDRRRVDEVVEMVGMSSRINEKVKKYSLGMKQRVGLAQALVHKPRVLILDEPTNGLDPVGIRELRDILKHLAHTEGIAVMVSSHMLSEMELMCDRVGIISGGRLLGVKPIKELLGGAASGKPVYRFATKQAEQAKAIILETHADILSDTGENFIELFLNEEEVPEINTLLAAQGIGIYGIAQKETSLEDAFINVTGGGLDIA